MNPPQPPAPLPDSLLHSRRERVARVPSPWSPRKPRWLRWLAGRCLLWAAACLGPHLPRTPAQTQTTLETRPAPPAAQFRSAPHALITERVEPGRRSEIPGALHPATARSQDLGQIDFALPIEHIQLALRRTPERQAAFDALVQAQNDPGSPSFHQWLTPEQVGAEFGPAASDLDAIAAYLQGQGFRINSVSNSRMWIDFTGSGLAVERGLHTALHRFRSPSGQLYTSAAKFAELPSALLPAISGFVSLSNLPFHPQHRPIPAYAVGSGQWVGAQDFYTIYNERPLLADPAPIDGTGQTIALIEDTDINLADVTAFRSLFGVTPVTSTITIQHGSTAVACADPGLFSIDEESEAVLDTEWAGAVAPGASLLLMSCADSQSTAGILLSAEAVIDDNLAGTLSLSYGATELGQASLGSFISNLYEQAAAQGQTVVVSSGDSGSDTESDGLAVARHGRNVNVLGSSAYNIAAGGTDFQDRYNQTVDGGTSFGTSAFWSPANGPGALSARSYVPETTWNDTCASGLLNAVREGPSAGPLALCEDSHQRGGHLAPIGGSGGESLLNARPPWQTSTVYGLPATSAYSGRLLPDVSLFASNGVWGHAVSFYQSDLVAPIAGAGGTSFAAPQLAGVFALIAQKTEARIGLANVELYTLAGRQFGTSSYAGSACNGSGASGTGETSSSPSADCLFYDIQTGNNAVPCRAGSPNCYTDSGQTFGLISTDPSAPLPAFAAGPGFDLATGIGSLNIYNLVNGWRNPPVSTVTTLSLTESSFPLNTSISFTSNVTPISGTGAPTGTVDLDTGTTRSTGPSAALSQGTATGTTSQLPGGTYTVFARYLGDSHFAPSSSSPVSVTVHPQATSTTIIATPAIGNVYASTVTLTATLSPVHVGIFTPSNTIAFLDGGTTLCAAVSFTPATGIASCTSPELSVGDHTFTAIYAGDTNFAPSTSPANRITVAKAAPSLTLSDITLHFGAASTILSASIAFGPGAPPTGPLTFSVAGGPAASANCVGSVSPLPCTAAYATGGLPAGTQVLSATLAGDANYTAASATGSLSVLGMPPVLHFSVPAQTYGSAPFPIAASSNSSGAFTYTVVSGPATIRGSNVTLTGIGAVVIAVSEAASQNYAAATQSASFSVTAGGSVWLGNAGGTLSTFSFAGAPLSPAMGVGGGAFSTVSGPLGMAFDAAGNLWVANSAGGVSEFNAAGASLSVNPYTVGGIHHPLSLAIDGAGQIWTANDNGSVSALANTGVPISPSTGFTGAGLSTPGGIAVDLSGNVWVANASDNSVTEFLGVAAPVATLATAVAGGTIGVRP